MIISVNWLKMFTDIDVSVDELAMLIGARLVEIEEVIDLGAKYKDVLIVKVVECAPLEGTDHLNLTKIDDGGVIKDIERDENGLIQVVCGAPNVHAGMLAAWLPPGSIVPETFNDSEPFVLTAKNLRGVISNGMLASAKELALYDDHTGIVEVDKDVEPGALFAKTYELDDYLLDIENKSLTHRPDAFGIIGFAREVAAIAGKTFVTPEWLAYEQPTYGEKTGDIKAPVIMIDNPELSARYEAVIMSNAKSNLRSSLETQTYLARVGVRPINAVVDVTNYLMMLTGQPLHAFDYDKLVAVSGGKNEIHVRAGKKGEMLELLDGRTIELTPEDIVIAAGDVAIGLAGAMGGANTVIDETTKNIVIESATFNLFSLRSTQMRHGIFSEAITRFTKGQPPMLTAPVLAHAIELMGDWAGAERASDVAEALGMQIRVPSIAVTTDRVNRVLGTSLGLDDIESTLESVEFATVREDGGNALSVAAPYWRADIHIVEDVIEEIGRIRGFDSIAPTLPTRNFTAVSPSEFDEVRTRIRKSLVRAGVNEVLTYSFVHGDMLQKVGQQTTDSYRITNSISPDLQYYRQSLTPSLLQLVHPNIKAGFESFALFEMNKVHPKQRGITNEDVPDEANALALTVVSNKNSEGAPYYEAKAILDFVATKLGLQLEYNALEQEVAYPTAAPFEYRRSAMVVDIASGEKLGMVGEYKKSIAKSFKLPGYIAGFELDVDALYHAAQASGSFYKSISRYPSSERDICFQVASGVSYKQIIDAAKVSLTKSELETSITPLDIYQPEDGKTKNITIRVKLTPHDHTLKSDEITVAIENVAQTVVATMNAKVI